MPFRGRNMTRELGAAFAVLALYVLVLLAPLHQAAGLQRDLAALGHPAWDQFSICTSLSRADPGERPADGLFVEQDLRRRRNGRVRHSTPFRPHGTGLKG